jgi:hypothetical protein
MDFVTVLIVYLATLNIFQLVFWSIQNRKLIDRIMSRNYAEYVQTEHLAKSSPKAQSQTQQPIIYDDSELNELNARLGGM